MTAPFTIRYATEHDVPTILGFIRALAKYEHLEHEVIATEAALRQTLFGPHRYAEVVFACVDDVPQGFALFFHNYSTFLARPGIYLEDLFVHPEARGHGLGKHLLTWLAQTAVERNCGRLEWSVLDWNEPSIGFYRSLGAIPLDEWTTFRMSGEALQALARG
jgi:GNAT superfamily N-acetyltransferase